ncbi:BgTH12-03690 [Blumeria graminis f. sp. triticale]|uniref:BgTH12-03690 n=1 Tax=Blumeria graminis f. sp. triticale TaxID=1689686 RepID=A0A9W4CW10_BLUGR|nr:BgTH12-03690 [Blumeria graminis f. sp. triticale]
MKKFYVADTKSSSSNYQSLKNLNTGTPQNHTLRYTQSEHSQRRISQLAKIDLVAKRHFTNSSIFRIDIMSSVFALITSDEDSQACERVELVMDEVVGIRFCRIPIPVRHWNIRVMKHN